VCFDNLSQLPDELADAACRLATGGGSGGQELYSDHDQAVFDAIRPMVFNAIPDLGAARPDFLDRTSIVEFSELKPEMRCDEARFWREFDGARGRILGALLDAAVAGLRNLPEVRIDHPPRMADFAIWESACETALGIRTGGFLQTYQDNRADGRVLTLESSPHYEPLTVLATEGFNGTTSELLIRLSAIATEVTRRSRRSLFGLQFAFEFHRFRRGAPGATAIPQIQSAPRSGAPYDPGAANQHTALARSRQILPGLLAPVLLSLSPAGHAAWR